MAVRLVPRKSPSDQIERWPIGRVNPAEFNPRTHTNADVQVMAKSLTEFGWTYPLLADEDGLLIAGHLRHRAALKLRMTHVPVIVARGWSSAQKKAYCIADNQIATRANWDLEKLITLIESLAVDEFDQSRLGFDPEELSRLLALPPCLGDPEAVPTPPEHPVSTLGDWWSLGHHRVGCGDCTDASVVEPHLSSANPTLMVADQPYGVNYDPAFRSRADGNRGRATGVVLNDDQADWLPAWRLFPGNVAYVWHGGLQGDVVMQSLRQCGFEVRSQIIWVKSHFAVGRSDYHWQHEPCLYVVRRGAKSHWVSDRKQSTVWEIANNTGCNPKRERAWGHGTQKPVECMRRPIEHNSKPGDTVYDPFLGTGTTLIAAEMTGRTCLGVELSPVYVDVTLQRWEEFTGRKAVHEASGKSFDETRVERLFGKGKAPSARKRSKCR